MKSILACLTLLLLVGCSSRGAYEGTQVNRVEECGRYLRLEAYHACLERARMPYDEYQEQREEILQEEVEAPER